MRNGEVEGGVSTPVAVIKVEGALSRTRTGAQSIEIARFRESRITDV
jgi:hypothetical protein